MAKLARTAALETRIVEILETRSVLTVSRGEGIWALLRDLDLLAPLGAFLVEI
jgi:hypothetical protein